MQRKQHNPNHRKGHTPATFFRKRTLSVLFYETRDGSLREMPGKLKSRNHSYLRDRIAWRPKRLSAKDLVLRTRTHRYKINGIVVMFMKNEVRQSRLCPAMDNWRFNYSFTFLFPTAWKALWQLRSSFWSSRNTATTSSISSVHWDAAQRTIAWGRSPDEAIWSENQHFLLTMSIHHFRVPLGLSFKATLGAKFMLWLLVLISKRMKINLSHSFAPLKNVEIRLHINGNSKIGMRFVYWRLNNCSETVYCSLFLRIARMEMYCISKNLVSICKNSRTCL